MGIIQEHKLQHVTFDIGQMQYTVDKYHITMLAGRKIKGRREPIEMDGIIQKYSDFNFGIVEVNELQLSKMDANYTPIVSIKI